MDRRSFADTPVPIKNRLSSGYGSDFDVINIKRDDTTISVAAAVAATKRHNLTQPFVEPFLPLGEWSNPSMKRASVAVSVDGVLGTQATSTTNRLSLHEAIDGHVVFPVLTLASKRHSHTDSQGIILAPKYEPKSSPPARTSVPNTRQASLSGLIPLSDRFAVPAPLVLPNEVLRLQNNALFSKNSSINGVDKSTANDVMEQSTQVKTSLSDSKLYGEFNQSRQERLNGCHRIKYVK